MEVAMEDNANHHSLHSNASEEEAVDISRTGTLWTAMANILTALIGAILFLPWAVAQLGWIAGPVAMIIFALVSLYAALLLVDCYRFPDPVSGSMRNCCYTDAVRVYLGETKARLCALTQYVVFYGTCVAFTLLSAISVRTIRESNCYHKKGHESSCHFPEHNYMILYGVIQVILCQIPNFNKLWAISIVAATMSFIYATLGFGLSIAKVIENGTIHGTLGGITTTASLSQGQKVWRILQSLGNIALAFPYTALVLEIQNTLKSPPPERKTMRKANWVSTMIATAFFMLCGCLGYAAFGENAPGNLLTGFGHETYWLIDFANACLVANLVGTYQCPFSLKIWDYVIAEMRLDWHWNHDILENFGEYFHRWTQTFRKQKSLFIFICWGIWRCRNDRIFNGFQASFEQVGSGIIGLYLDWWMEEADGRSRRRIIEPLVIDSYPVGYFDGAAQMNCGGCGFLLLVSENHSFKGWLAVEESTNNFSELVAAWALLFWARHIFIRELRLFGDSRVVIDWLNNQATIHSIYLQHWCNKIKGLLEEFSDFQCCHIYRELNEEADYLSKRGLFGTPGVLHVEEWRDGSRITGHIITLF